MTANIRSMTPLHVALLVVALHAQAPELRAQCGQWQECRQLALDAAAREDYETFHTLAWRAVQTGPRNDADLMYLLARAQSLSGRPGDALVMLQRVARMGVQTDAATNPDFRRVRALPAWAEPEVTAKRGDTSNPPESRPVPETSVAERRSAAAKAEAATTRVPEAATASEPGKPAESGTAARSTAPPPARTSVKAIDPAPVDPRLAPAESLRFTTAPFTPAGLAYDGVSRRFIVGDRHARKLAVVDEFSHHVANLASAQSSGFGDIQALEIDVRLGNLWVVSNDPASGHGSADGSGAATTGKPTVHKLQLVSGRLLARYVLPERFGAGRFADIAAAADGSVLVLDAAGRRLFRLPLKGQALELAATLGDVEAVSVAPASADVVYVATADGITHVDLGSRAATRLKANKSVDIRGVTRVRWFKNALIAVQQGDAGTFRAIRISLAANGRTATAVQVLDPSLATSDPTAATVSGGMLYYLANGDGTEMIVKHVPLQ
jgi:hypothetical protein